MDKKKLTWSKDMGLLEKVEYIRAYANQLPDIKTPEVYNNAGTAIRIIAGVIEEVAQDFAEAKGEAYATHKKICADEKTITSPLQDTFVTLKTKMLLWRDKKESDEHACIQQMLDENPQADIPPSQIPEPDGIRIQKEVVPLVINPNLVPHDYMIPDMKKLTEFGRSTGGEGTIPGVAFQKVSKMVVSKQLIEEKV